MIPGQNSTEDEGRSSSASVTAHCHQLFWENSRVRGHTRVGGLGPDQYGGATLVLGSSEQQHCCYCGPVVTTVLQGSLILFRLTHLSDRFKLQSPSFTALHQLHIQMTSLK